MLSTMKSTACFGWTRAAVANPSSGATRTPSGGSGWRYPRASDAPQRALLRERPVIVHERISRARIHADSVGDAQPLDCPQRVGDLLLQPFVPGHDGDAQQFDRALRVQLRGHDADHAVIAGRREIGVEDHLLTTPRLHVGGGCRGSQHRGERRHQHVRSHGSGLSWRVVQRSGHRRAKARRRSVGWRCRRLYAQAGVRA